MSRPAVLTFACLASFLVLLPLALKQPGLPMQLSGAEPTQFLMAASLAADGDLICDAADLTRLFDTFPFASGMRLELASDDGWRTARYARPVVYPLLAAPLAGLWGARGLVALNGLFFVLAVAVAAAHLRRWLGDGRALLFACGYFFLSTAFVYLFRMQPQIFLMAMVTVSLGLGWLRRDDGSPATPFDRHRHTLSGVALALATLQEPALVLLALPLLAGLVRHRRRDAGRWITGWVAATAVAALLSFAWTGGVGPARGGAEVASFTLDDPLEIPWLGGPGEDPDGAGPGRPAGDRGIPAVLEDAGFLLWGRRTGALPYFPLLIPVLAVFAGAARRTKQGWALLAVVAGLGLLQLTLEPASLAAHDGEVGNPHLVAVYPAFLFLLTRLPRPAITAAYALGAGVLSTLLLTPLGAVTPEAPTHAHTRNFPFRLLPFEYPALGRAAGFHRLEVHGLEAAGTEATTRLWVPADQTEILGNDLWILGGESAELWLESRLEVPSAVFHLRNLAPGNRISMQFAGKRERHRFEEVPPDGVTVTTELAPERPSRVRRDGDGPIYFYRLAVETRLGEKPKWRMKEGGRDYLGAGLQLLGTRDFLARDLYDVEWTGCGAPPAVAPGEELLAVARLRNASNHRWHSRGPARVRLSYHWLDAEGREVVFDGLRTDLQGDVEPGQELAAWLSVTAPADPGRYLLEIDPLFENVAWFSRRNGGRTCRSEVEVVAAGSPGRTGS